MCYYVKGTTGTKKELLEMTELLKFKIFSRNIRKSSWKNLRTTEREGGQEAQYLTSYQGSRKSTENGTREVIDVL